MLEQKTKVYLFLPSFVISDSMVIGGAEKRFFALWCQYCKLGYNVTMVCSIELFNTLKNIREFAKYDLEKFENEKFIPSTFTNIKTYYKDLLKFKLINNIKDVDFLHFAIVAPIGFFKNRTIFSCVFSGLNIFNLKGKMIQLLSVFFSDHIDVLDPNYTNKFKLWFFYKKNRITNTPNSFTDPEYYQPSYPKENYLTFLGSFAPEKQILKLLDTVSNLDRRNNELLMDKLAFKILGDGPLKNEVINKVSDLKSKGIDIEYKFTKNPVTYLAKSKLFFSLQKNTNYPSKSLIEAMSCGNLIVATNCGDTKLLAKPDFTEYIKEEFEEDEIIKACLNILSLREVDYLKKSRLARQVIVNEFSIDTATNYFKTLYHN